MKDYHNYPIIYIGSNDIASLTLRSPMEAKVLNFGIDADYNAYIVDENAKIGSHYHLEYECETWLKVYDDDNCMKTFYGDIIKVYRAGEMGCII